MKTAFLIFFALSVVAAPAHAAQGRPATQRVVILDGLVQLTPAQKPKALEIFERERQALASDASEPATDWETRERSRAEIRAILTAEQQKIYDRTRTAKGGGLTLPEPQTRLERLDRDVGGLTPAQKATALSVFTEEFESLLTLHPDDRGAGGMHFRQAAREHTRSLLTPEQIARLSAKAESDLKQESDQSLALRNALRGSPAVAARVGTPTLIAPQFGTTSSTASGSRGETRFKVTGEKGTAHFTVTWERAQSAASPIVTGIAENVP